MPNISAIYMYVKGGIDLLVEFGYTTATKTCGTIFWWGEINKTNTTHTN